jgi:hypothetical protein
VDHRETGCGNPKWMGFGEITGFYDEGNELNMAIS